MGEVIIVVVTLTGVGHAAVVELVLFGAGIRRETMTQIARDSKAGTGTLVRTELGPIGRDGEGIEARECVDVFTSADGSLAAARAAGQASAIAMSTRSAVCALSTPRVGLTAGRLLRPAAPSGHQAWPDGRVADPGPQYAAAFKRRRGQAMQRRGDLRKPVAVGPSLTGASGTTRLGRVDGGRCDSTCRSQRTRQRAEDPHRHEA